MKEEKKTYVFIIAKPFWQNYFKTPPWVFHGPRRLWVQAKWNMSKSLGQQEELEMSVHLGYISDVLWFLTYDLGRLVWGKVTSLVYNFHHMTIQHNVIEWWANVFLWHQKEIFFRLYQHIVMVSNIPATLSLISKEIYALSEHKCVLSPNSI